MQRWNGDASFDGQHGAYWQAVPQGQAYVQAQGTYQLAGQHQGQAHGVQQQQVVDWQGQQQYAQAYASQQQGAQWQGYQQQGQAQHWQGGQQQHIAYPQGAHPYPQQQQYTAMWQGNPQQHGQQPAAGWVRQQQYWQGGHQAYPVQPQASYQLHQQQQQQHSAYQQHGAYRPQGGYTGGRGQSHDRQPQGPRPDYPGRGSYQGRGQPHPKQGRAPQGGRGSWVPPDLSKGFAPIYYKKDVTKYDDLPARMPEILSEAATPASATTVEPAAPASAPGGTTAEPQAKPASSPAAGATDAATAQPEVEPAAAVSSLTASGGLDATMAEAQAEPAAAAGRPAGIAAEPAGSGPDDDTPETQERADAAAAEPIVGSSVAPAADSTMAPADTTAPVTAEERQLQVILLFDLNGTLTSHTHQKRSSGVTRVRPGVEALARLAYKYRVGIFSSATHRTVGDARLLLEQTTGAPLFEPGLILHRDHTAPAPQAAGKDWDTAKPLSRWFSRLHRLLLLDDDEHKSLPDERDNLVLVPAWVDEDPGCTVLVELVDALEEVLGSLKPDEDIRPLVPAITARLKTVADARAAQLLLIKEEEARVKKAQGAKKEEEGVDAHGVKKEEDGVDAQGGKKEEEDGVVDVLGTEAPAGAGESEMADAVGVEEGGVEVQGPVAGGGDEGAAVVGGQNGMAAGAVVEGEMEVQEASAAGPGEEGGAKVAA